MHDVVSQLTIINIIAFQIQKAFKLLISHNHVTGQRRQSAVHVIDVQRSTEQVDSWPLQGEEFHWARWDGQALWWVWLSLININ